MRDNDSVMCMYNKTNNLHKYPSNDAIDLPNSVEFGKALGQREDELKEGELVNEFAVGGAKIIFI